MKQKPDLSFWKLWNLSFGFFGVQIAYALQSGNISRIFRTLGADPHSLSFFWILPPLMGILVQPIVGTLSDRTWTRFGRRIPYLFLGAAAAVAVMCLLPNAGSFGMAVGTALIFGLFALMLLGLYLCFFRIPEAAHVKKDGLTIVGRKDISDQIEHYKEEMESDT